MLALFLSLLFADSVAAPRDLEVWFLTPPKTSYLEKFLRDKTQVVARLGQAPNCEAIGDYCFDPQIGLYKKNDNQFVPLDPVDVKLDEELPQLPSAKSLDRNLIDCDPKNAFDLFCGKAKPVETQASSTNLEIWMDTSSSLREMDFADKDGSCNRERFLRQLDGVCPFQKKVSVMMYDVSIREMGAMNSACQAVGQNDTKRLMDWIERSEAKHLIVITDVNEYGKDFADFISAHHGKIRGDRGSFTSADLIPLAQGLGATCK